MPRHKQLLLAAATLILLSAVLASTFSNVEVHLDDHNSDILFHGEHEFEEFKLYDSAVEIDGRNITISSDSSDLIETNISNYDPVGSDEIIELETSTSDDADVEFEFDGPDGEYIIQRNGEHFEQQVVSGELTWSYDSWNEDHTFTVIEDTDREVWVDSIQPNNTNVDHETITLQARGYASITEQVTVEFYQEDGTFIDSSEVENGSIATAEPDLETQNEYNWYAEVTDGDMTIQSDLLNFTTIDLDFSWTDTSDIEDGFIIETNHTTEEIDNFEEIQELPQETEQTRITHPELKFDENICLKVRSFNVGGISDPAEACITTPETPEERPWE